MGRPRQQCHYRRLQECEAIEWDAPHPPGPAAVLAAAFVGLVFDGVELGLMPVASLSVSKGFLGEAFTPTARRLWFARFTAALMFGAAVGGIALGHLGDRIGRTRAMGVSILCYSLFAALGARGRKRRSRCSSCDLSLGWVWGVCGPTALPWSPSAGRTPRGRSSPGVTSAGLERGHPDAFPVGRGSGRSPPTPGGGSSNSPACLPFSGSWSWSRCRSRRSGWRLAASRDVGRRDFGAASSGLLASRSRALPSARFRWWEPGRPASG